MELFNDEADASLSSEEQNDWRQLRRGLQAANEQFRTTRRISKFNSMTLYTLVFELITLGGVGIDEAARRQHTLTRRARLFAMFQTLIKHRIQEQMRMSSIHNLQTETTLNQAWTITKEYGKYAKQIFMYLDRYRTEDKGKIVHHPELDDAMCRVFEEFVLLPEMQKRQASLLPAVTLEQVNDVISEENCIARLEKVLGICDQPIVKPSVLDPDLETFKQFSFLTDANEPRGVHRARILFRYPMLARAVFARGTFWNLARQIKTREVVATTFCYWISSAIDGEGNTSTVNRSRSIIVNELVYILTSEFGIGVARGYAEESLKRLGVTSTDVLLIHLQTWSKIIQITSRTIPFGMLPMDKMPMIRACLEH